MQQKALHTMLISFIMVLSFLSQAWTATFQKWYGQKQFSTNTAHALSKTVDGGYVIAGQRQEDGKVYLAKLDQNGVCKMTGTFNGAWGEAALEDISSGFYFSGLESGGSSIVLHSDTLGNADWITAPLGAVLFSMAPSYNGGIVATGYSGTDIALISVSQDGNIRWQKNYGGPLAEDAGCVRAISGNRYIIGGTTFSYGAGNGDAYLICVDSVGSVIWTKTYGDTLSESVQCVEETVDSELIIVGRSGPFNNSVNSNFLAIRHNKNGDTLWQRTFGSTNYDALLGVAVLQDNGFIATGVYNGQICLFRLSSSGDSLWLKTYGNGLGYDVVENGSDGFVFCADSGYYDSMERWIGKGVVIATDVMGNESWRTSYATSGDDIGYAVQVLGDNSYLALASGDHNLYRIGPSGDLSSSARLLMDNPKAMLKTPDSHIAILGSDASNLSSLIYGDSAGNPIWQKSYAGMDVQAFLIADAGFIIAGSRVPPGDSAADMSLLKTKTNGDSAWSKSYGSGLPEFASSAARSADGNFLIAGVVRSGSNNYDMVTLCVNPQGDSLWMKKYGNLDNEYCNSIINTSDGGFLLIGSGYVFGSGKSSLMTIKADKLGAVEWQSYYENSDIGFAAVEIPQGGYAMVGVTGSQHIALVRINAAGDTLYTRRFGSSNGDWPRDIKYCPDGGFVIAGNSSFGDDRTRDVYLIKTDSDGNAAGIRNSTLNAKPANQFFKIFISQMPLASIFEISAASENASKANIAILDVRGRIIQQIELQTSRKMIWDATALSPGTYFIFGTADSYRDIVRIVIKR